MIIDLKKYKEHGYLKAIWLIFSKLLVASKFKILSDSGSDCDVFVYKNYPQLMRNDEDKLSCISCKLCEKICPTQCLEIKSKKISDDLVSGEAPNLFRIDLLRCTRCSLCEQVCPTDAIKLEGDISREHFNDAFDLLKKN